MPFYIFNRSNMSVATYGIHFLTIIYSRISKIMNDQHLLFRFIYLFEIYAFKTRCWELFKFPCETSLIISVLYFYIRTIQHRKAISQSKSLAVFFIAGLVFRYLFLMPMRVLVSELFVFIPGRTCNALVSSNFFL